MDTNAFLLSVRTHFPLESEVDRIYPGARLVVPASVIDELDRLVARRVPGARAAAALARKFSMVPADGRGDSAIVDAAHRYRSWVMTADRALATRLRNRGVSVLVPRDRHHLELLRGRAAPAPTARRPSRP